MSEAANANQVKTRAHVAPFVLFLLLLLIPDVAAMFGSDSTDATANSLWQLPMVWMYLVQILVCGTALMLARRNYEFAPFRCLGLATVCGIVGIAVWIAPGFLFEQLNMSSGWWRHFGFASRAEGFDPSSISAQGSAAWLAFMAIRFLRLAIIVPLVEEIFWRGFLMRFLVDPDSDFWNVPFGTHHRRSLIVVTALFAMAHAPIDYVAAVLYGLLTYWLAVKTKSLSACVLMHAVANLLLGVYVVATEQWGYW